MLMFIKPSFVSLMPCKPTLFIPFAPVTNPTPAPLPVVVPDELPLPTLSPSTCPLGISLAARPAHHPPSRCAGLGGRIGLPWMLRPGLTARRLNISLSSMSSRRRLPSVLRMQPCASLAAVGFGWGVEDRLGLDQRVGRLECEADSAVDPFDTDSPLLFCVGGSEEPGVSMLTSSLIAEGLARKSGGGGGVRVRSSNVVQKSRPAECLLAASEKLEDERRSCEVSAIVSATSDMSSGDSTGPPLPLLVG